MASAHPHPRDHPPPAGHRSGSSRVIRDDLQGSRSARSFRQDVGPRTSRVAREELGPLTSKTLREDYGVKSSRNLRDDFGTRSLRSSRQDYGARSSRSLRDDYGVRNNPRPDQNEYDDDWGARWVAKVDLEVNGDRDPDSGKEMNDAKAVARSERKRMWRKNLSAEKLAKLRERDALRKRMERQNMSAEKRKDVRTKDTARKAALRRERRMSERGQPGGDGDLPPAGAEDERSRKKLTLDDAVDSDDYAGKLDAKFRKISVQSLLN